VRKNWSDLSTSGNELENSLRGPPSLTSLFNYSSHHGEKKRRKVKLALEREKNK